MFDSLNGWALNTSLDQLYQCENGIWKLTVKPVDAEYIEIFGFSKNNLWLGCLGNKTYRYFFRHFNGIKWHNIYPPNSDRIRELVFIAPDNIWGACEWGEIIHYDGREWQLISNPTFGHLNSIAFVNDSLGWAIGEYRSHSILLKWNGKKWNKMKSFDHLPLGNIFMVNSKIGCVFTTTNTSMALHVEGDQISYVNFANLVKDSIFCSFDFYKNPLVFFPNRMVIQGGNIA